MSRELLHLLSWIVAGVAGAVLAWMAVLYIVIPWALRRNERILRSERTVRELRAQDLKNELEAQREGRPRLTQAQRDAVLNRAKQERGSQPHRGSQK